MQKKFNLRKLYGQKDVKTLLGACVGHRRLVMWFSSLQSVASPHGAASFSLRHLWCLAGNLNFLIDLSASAVRAHCPLK